MADLAAVKERVRRILIDRLGSVEEDRDGDFTIRNGSARCFIRISARNEQFSLVRTWALVASDVPPSPAFFEYVARKADDFYFGHLSVFEDPESKLLTLVMSHTLLGDFLDADELMFAVIGVASSADELDDQVVADFGGRKFHE